MPLHVIPLQVSALILFLLNPLVLLPLVINLIYKILREMKVDAKKTEMTLILATLLTLKYFWNNLVMFQINFILFDILLIGFYYLVKRKPQISGVLFLFVTFWKIIPVFLGIEGSDTTGEKIYLAIRFYDIYTLLLLGLFVFCSWVVVDRNSGRFYPGGLQI